MINNDFEETIKIFLFFPLLFYSLHNKFIRLWINFARIPSLLHQTITIFQRERGEGRRKKSRHVVYVHKWKVGLKRATIEWWQGTKCIKCTKGAYRIGRTIERKEIGQWRWREIVTSMDVVAWGSGGARASGLRLTQLHGLWWRIYGLGSRERCLPENQASPSTDPFFSSFFFFSFSSVSRFLLLLLLLLWSGADRHAMNILERLRSTTPPSTNRFVNYCLKDSSFFGIDTVSLRLLHLVRDGSYGCFFFFFWDDDVRRVNIGNAINLRKL